MTTERRYSKGGHAEVIPNHAQFLPFLRDALNRSPSELVFPHVCYPLVPQVLGLDKPNGYLLGSYCIATAPEPNSSRLTSLKSTCFDSPANNVGP